jgi:hypothetical protein
LREWYELKFSYEFRSKFGAEFQDFFTSIMERRYPSDFQKVKPYGKYGDRKCDGYHQSLKRVFQVYAPEKMNVEETNSKIKEDFTGAVKHWKEKLSTWVFVHNQWRGIPADVLKQLLAINGRNNVGVLHWCEPEIHDEFFELGPDLQALLLGPAPTPRAISHLGMKDVIQVANAIAQMDVPPPEEIREVPAGKLRANSLSVYVQTLLTMGSLKAKLVENLFGQWHDPELGDRIARAFRSRYEELRSNSIIGDECFLQLWRFAGGGAQNSMNLEAAVLAVLAFLFEECDIFEAPRDEATN